MFGRTLSATGITGASTTVNYLDSEVPQTVGGVDLRVFPEGKTTRQINVHLDSFGRETVRWGVPIDGTKTLTSTTRYDKLGHIIQRMVLSVSGGTVTTLNTESLSWDDMDRLLSDCRLTSYYVTGAPVTGCKSNAYSGLQVVATD
jgi:hypothetical protein